MLEPDGTKKTYNVIAAADQARIANAVALLAAGHIAEARAALDAVQVLTWRAEQVRAGIREEERMAA